MPDHELPPPSNWHYPTSIRFGAGRLAELPEACRELGIAGPLLVTDSGLAGAPFIGRAAALCEQAGMRCALFSEVRGNPSEANVTSGVAAFKEGGHDGVIAIGGGSAMDTAKAVALMVGQRRPLRDFEDREDWYTRADAAAIKPVVALSTTSGTGSEVGRAAVITDSRDQTKKIIFHPRMLPGRVILDPELTTGLPPHLSAAVGMDALAHNLEAWCSPSYHPLAAGIALEGMRLIHRYLPRVFRDGGDLVARAHMQVAAAMGATAFQKGLGAIHSLSHPCGSLLDTHHGLTNAVLMPYVLVFNRAAIEGKMAGLGRCLGLPDASFDGVLAWVLELRHTLHIPHTLAELGVSEDMIPRMAAMAEIDPSSATNPAPLTVAALATMYQDALHGRLQA